MSSNAMARIFKHVNKTELINLMRQQFLSTFPFFSEELCNEIIIIIKSEADDALASAYTELFTEKEMESLADFLDVNPWFMVKNGRFNAAVLKYINKHCSIAIGAAIERNLPSSKEACS